MRSEIRRRIGLALKILMTLGLLIATIRFIEIDKVFEYLAAAKKGYFICAALVVVAGCFAGSASWYCVLKVRFPDVLFRKVVSWYWCGLFFNSFMPSNIGGDVVKGYVVSRDKGNVGFVVSSLLTDRIINLGILLCIGFIALLIQLKYQLWAIVFCALCIGMLAIAPVLARFIVIKIDKLYSNGLVNRIVGFILPIVELAATPKLFISTILAACVSQSCKIGQNVFAIWALGVSIPVFSVWYLIPLLGVVSALPVSIGGLGVREMVALSLAGPMQVDTTDLVVLSLVGHFMVVLVNMFGVIPFLFGRKGVGERSVS